MGGDDLSEIRALRDEMRALRSEIASMRLETVQRVVLLEASVKGIEKRQDDVTGNLTKAAGVALAALFAAIMAAVFGGGIQK